jgi:hypothetical protein
MAQRGSWDGVGTAFEEMDQVEFYRTQVKNSRIQEFENAAGKFAPAALGSAFLNSRILEF